MRNTPSSGPTFINRDRLAVIRQTANWQATFAALGFIKDQTRSQPDDWWALSPFAPDELTASFHMNADDNGVGQWYCFSIGQGGSLLDLVAKMEGTNIYDAGRWLIDHGCCDDPATQSASPESAQTAKPASKAPAPDQAGNVPIRHDRWPLLD